LRPSEAFDRVLETVRRFQANQHRIPAIPLKRESSGGPPKVGNWRTEYVAEFVLSGRQALKPWPKRYELFELYFVSNVGYSNTLKLMQIEAYTLDWYVREIKKAVGRELLRRGLHKPLQYPETAGKKTTDLTEEIL
jgi:hypothetical protein